MVVFVLCWSLSVLNCNVSLLAELFHSSVYFLGFYKRKFERIYDFFLRKVFAGHILSRVQGQSCWTYYSVFSGQIIPLQFESESISKNHMCAKPIVCHLEWCKSSSSAFVSLFTFNEWQYKTKSRSTVQILVWCMFQAFEEILWRGFLSPNLLLLTVLKGKN